MRSATPLLLVPASVGLIVAAAVWPQRAVPQPVAAPSAGGVSAYPSPQPPASSVLARPALATPIPADEEGEPESDDDSEPEAFEAVVRGRVTVDVGQLPKSVTIAVERVTDGGEAWAFRATYESDGTFEVFLEPGSYRLIFRGEGFLPAAVEGVQVAAKEEIRGLMVTLTPGDRVGGRVISAADASPISGQLVTLRGSGFSFKGWTDDRGEFSFEGVPATWDQEPVRFLVEAVDSDRGSDRATVGAGETGILLTLDRRATVRGTVVDEQGNAVPLADIFVGTPEADWSAADEDPFGKRELPETIRMRGFGSCSNWPACLATGTSDAQGRFEVRAADVAGLRLAAMEGDRRCPPVTLSKAEDARLVLRPTSRVRVRIVDGGTPGSVELVECNPKLGDMLAFAQSFDLTDSRREVELALWPGVPCVFSGPEGAQLEAVGPLPPEAEFATEPAQ